MQTEIYKGCKIISTPHKLVDAGGFNYSVNGIIQIELSSQVTDIMIENLKIPDKDWKHVSEDGADEVFIKHAKIYIENNVT